MTDRRTWETIERLLNHVKEQHRRRRGDLGFDAIIWLWPTFVVRHRPFDWERDG